MVITMYPQKNGRIKYLLLTMIPPLVLMYLFQFLLQRGFLPGGSAWGLIYISISMALMMINGYFLIFRKNHSILIKGNTLTETDWLRKEAAPIKASQIHSFRKNILNEIVLLDEHGTKLICIESNMTNFAQFERWLHDHRIN